MRYDKPVDPFYNSTAWRRLRRQAMLRDGGMCVTCMAEFAQCERVRPEAATLVHHVIPVEQRPDLALDLDNLVSLCDSHHAKCHPEKGKRGNEDNKPLQTEGGPVIVKI